MKNLLCLLIMWNISISSAQDPNLVVPINNKATAYLYGNKVSSLSGNITKENGDFMKVSGPGSLSWKVNVKASGLYHVNFNHSVRPSAEGTLVRFSSGKNVLDYQLVATNGVWGEGSYENLLISNTIRLTKGEQLITLEIPPSYVEGLTIRNLEFIPVKIGAKIKADHDLAESSRPNTDWLPEKKYGVMFHWTSESVSIDGPQKKYAQAVNDFDVDSFVNMVRSTGAGYVIFTVGHAEAYCPAPLNSWERIHPGHTTKRDLIMEIADSLAVMDIKLICYFPTHIVGKIKEITSIGEFAKINTDIMTEFGQRYGKKVAGYWFDGWYQSFEKFPDFNFKEFYETCKIGNPDRLISLNSWVYPSVSPWQDYWAGETASPVNLPDNGTLAQGPGKGLRYQSLVIMEPYWVQEKKQMPKPRFEVNELSRYIEECNLNGGVVTINLGIYQDGSIGKEALGVMMGVNKRINKK